MDFAWTAILLIAESVMMMQQKAHVM